MLVRLDPQTKYISLLSLPRDLHVTIPAYKGIPAHVDKINAAYSEGGYKLALKTVEQATGVTPNYLLTVDFKGFKDLVNAFHGVYVPVDERYYHVNTAGTEQYSQINIPPGYMWMKWEDVKSRTYIAMAGADGFKARTLPPYSLLVG